MNMKDFLPSRKIQIIISIIALLALGYGVFVLIKNIIARQHEQNVVFVSPVDTVDGAQQEYLTLDTDNDGAYDWEEALWSELDPENPDSDNDGVLDGEYIFIKNAIAQRDEVVSDVELDISETSKLGRSLYTALLAIEQEGSSIDGVTSDQISSNVADYIADLSFSEVVYTRDQLLLVDNTREASFGYRDVMKKLFQEHPVATSDIELIIKATENPDEYKGRIRAIHLKYRNYFDKLVLVEVPYAIASQHTRLINVIGKYEAALANLQAEESDELVTLSSLVQIENLLNETTDAIVKINTYFEILDEVNEFDIALDEDE